MKLRYLCTLIFTILFSLSSCQLEARKFFYDDGNSGASFETNYKQKDNKNSFFSYRNPTNKFDGLHAKIDRMSPIKWAVVGVIAVLSYIALYLAQTKS